MLVPTKRSLAERRRLVSRRLNEFSRRPARVTGLPRNSPCRPETPSVVRGNPVPGVGCGEGNEHPDTSVSRFIATSCRPTTSEALEAQRLVELRDRWLNPPEWVEGVDEPVPGYPKRPVPRDEYAAKALKKRTLTNF